MNNTGDNSNTNLMVKKMIINNKSNIDNCKTTDGNFGKSQQNNCPNITMTNAITSENNFFNKTENCNINHNSHNNDGNYMENYNYKKNKNLNENYRNNCNNKYIFIANIYCFGQQRRTFCYKISENMTNSAGSIVRVSFGKRKLIGIILSVEKVEIINDRIKTKSYDFCAGKLKDIDEILYTNLLSKNFIDFLQKMSWYNVIDIERLLEIVIPSVWLKKKREPKPLHLKNENNDICHNSNGDTIHSGNNCKTIQLNCEQEKISHEIYNNSNNFSVSLLRGVMGSGKTYIFLDIVRKKLVENQNSQALIMVPEIALTNSLMSVIYDFCGIEPIIWHSSVSVAKKKIYYENIINGNVRIVISTRSGLLLPYKNLSLIVIDEEHDQSYKQDEIPVYHARDMAILRAKYENIPVILSSATPSIETLVNVLNKKYKLYKINTQYFHNDPPKVVLVDILHTETCKKNDIKKTFSVETEKSLEKEQNKDLINEQTKQAEEVIAKTGEKEREEDKIEKKEGKEINNNKIKIEINNEQKNEIDQQTSKEIKQININKDNEKANNKKNNDKKKDKEKDKNNIENNREKILNNCKEISTNKTNQVVTNYISQISRDAILNTLKKGEQSMVFINRRGYSRTLKCNNCGYETKCKNCDNFLSYHKQKNSLKCHYCGYSIRDIKKCQMCGSEKLSPNKGVGVEQIEAEIKSFCNAETMLFSSDEICKESDIDNISDKIKHGNIDVIIGTQIMTKGHHFPKLTNIIVLDIDGISLDGDFRAFEKMFQMLFQLSGRAGREKKDATIYIQTIDPENNVLKTIQTGDASKFYNLEIHKRKQYNLPPYCRYVAIIVASENKEDAYNAANDVLKELRKCISKNFPDPSCISLLGPSESSIHYLKRNYHYRFLLKSPKDANLLNSLNEFRINFKAKKNVQIKIDVDPWSFV